jgi:uncharacterized protein YegP (UPF0339 family)
LECANKIIESGKYELSSDYSSNFAMSLDHTNKEVIFSVPYDRVYAVSDSCKMVSAVSRLVFGSSYQCWAVRLQILSLSIRMMWMISVWKRLG